MLASLTLKCSNCGSNLEITSEMSTFACGYCGASQMVQRQGGTVSLKLLSESISKVQIGTDKTAAELAIKRLKEEIEEANLQFSAHEKKRLEEVGQANALFGILWAFGAILCIIIIGYSGAVIIPTILLVAGTGGVLFFYAKNSQRINQDNSKRRQKTTDEINSIKLKISKNKEIVDSI